MYGHFLKKKPSLVPMFLHFVTSVLFLKLGLKKPNTGICNRFYNNN